MNQNADPIALQRSTGNVRVSFKQRDGKTVLDDLYQAGSGKIRMARSEPGRLSEAVIINTTGGLTDGDEFASEIHWQKDTTAILTTQAAERIYQSRRGNAVITSKMQLDEGATGLWLPQETILFDGGRLLRSNNIDLHGTAQLIAVEATIFGRTAMGEKIISGLLVDEWYIRIDGKLVFADRFRLQDDMDAKLRNPAIANGANALATIIHAAPLHDLGQIRNILENQPCTGGSTMLGPLSVTRLFADNAQDLRRGVVAVLDALIAVSCPKHAGSLLPRVWSL
jgi:urease accessory protein